ncbi:MAG: chloride channel protein [Nitrolancea sp.]
MNSATPSDMPSPSGQSLLQRLGIAKGDSATTRTQYFARWVMLGILVGIVAGLAAITFYWLLETSTHIFLGHLVGYHPPSPVGEGNQPESSWGHRWALPLVVALGGLISGLIVFLLAPEAEGHGTDAAIEAFHQKAGRVRARIIPIKTIASAITIGSGGSGGREGPTAQIAAGVGSLLGQALKLDANERRILVATGIGAGIGAIFRAPLGGAVLAAEILYIHDLEIEALFPSLIASIVGYTIFASYAGWSPIFGTQSSLDFSHAPQLIYYAIIGLICGGFGVLYAKTFYGVTDIFHHIHLPNWSKPMIGGLLVGLLGLAVPQAIGTGYGWLQEGMTPTQLVAIPLWILLLVPFAKIVATSLSIGSGGSGGIFGPGMVVGGFIGAAFWQIFHNVLPSMPNNPTPFAIVAMMALFGGIAHAPLSVMLMVAEMTGNLSLLAPAMIAVGLATLVTGDNTIYRSQLATRADSPAHRYKFSFPLLNTLAVRDAMTTSPIVLTPDMRLTEVEQTLEERSLTGSPVVDEHKHLVGVVTLTDISHVSLDDRESTKAESIMTRNPFTISADATLDVALESLASHGVSWMPVVEGREQKVIGTVSAADVVSTYRASLRWTVRRMRGLTVDTVMLEYRVDRTSPLAGKALRELSLPTGSLVVSVNRNGSTVLPRGNTTMQPGDVVTFLTNPENEALVREYLSDGQRNVESKAIAAT